MDSCLVNLFFWSNCGTQKLTDKVSSCVRVMARCERKLEIEGVKWYIQWSKKNKDDISHRCSKISVAQNSSPLVVEG